MTVGDRIRELREYRGLTQEQLAKKLGLSGKSSISKIEKSGDDITLKNIERIADALYASPSYLMGWIDNPAQLTLFDVDDNGDVTLESIHKNFEERYKNHVKENTILLSDEERTIIDIYRNMESKEKEMFKRVINYAERLIEFQKRKGE